MSLSVMQRRLCYNGGASQQERMKLDRERSLAYAEKYSYQAAHFKLYPVHQEGSSFQGVFNPVSHNLQYDTKMISTKDKRVGVGSVFFWEEVPSYWLCYAKDMTDLAYFRGECRICNYSIQWVDKNRKLNETYAAVIGTMQVSVGYQQSPSAMYDLPDETITVMVTDNEVNRLYFNQNQYFIIRGTQYKIQTVDNLSMFGVIKMSCKQNFANLIEDDVENDISNAWNIQPVFNHFPNEEKIVGKTTIIPLFPEEYKLNADFGIEGAWYAEEINTVTKTDRHSVVTIEYDEKDNRRCRLTWNNRNHGNFILRFKGKENQIISQRHIIVDSLM